MWKAGSQTGSTGDSEKGAGTWGASVGIIFRGKVGGGGCTRTRGRKQHGQNARMAIIFESKGSESP